MRPASSALLRALRLASASVFAAVAASGCTQILGGDTDYHLASTTSGAGATAGTTSTGTAGNGAAGSSTGETGGTNDSTGATTPTTTGTGATGAGGTTSTGGSITTTGGAGGSSTTTTTGTGGSGGVIEPCDEADLMTSPNHCGACDHSCLGGACELGECQPFTLAEDLAWLNGFALDGTHVYWLTIGDGKIERVTKSGAARDLIVSGQTAGRAMIVDSTYVYWAVPGMKKLLRAAKMAGAVASPMASNITAPTSLARVSDGILVTQGSPANAIIKWPLQGAVSTTIATGQESPSLLATDGTYAYFATLPVGAANDSVKRVPADGSTAPVSFADALSAPVALATDGTFVYWAASDGTIGRSSSEGQAVTIASGFMATGGVAVDATHVYWTTSLASGESNVMRAAKDGSEPVTLAAGPTRFGQIATDEAAIYWMEDGLPDLNGVLRGALHKLAK